MTPRLNRRQQPVGRIGIALTVKKPGRPCAYEQRRCEGAGKECKMTIPFMSAGAFLLITFGLATAIYCAAKLYSGDRK